MPYIVSVCVFVVACGVCMLLCFVVHECMCAVCVFVVACGVCMPCACSLLHVVYVCRVCVSLCMCMCCMYAVTSSLKQSITFDPFMYLSVPLPQVTGNVFVDVLCGAVVLCCGVCIASAL